MTKSTLEDTFEKLVEQGASQSKKTAKTAVKQVKQTISPSKLWEQILGVTSDSVKTEAVEEPSESEGGRTASVEKVRGNKSHTPLNLEKLTKSYQDNEKQKTEILRQRLFQMVKRGEEEILQKKKQEEMEKKRKEAYEEQEKKRKAEEKKKQEQAGEIPRGKVRRSIFSRKRVAERQRSEYKPASGKQ